MIDILLREFFFISLNISKHIKNLWISWTKFISINNFLFFIYINNHWHLSMLQYPRISQGSHQNSTISIMKHSSLNRKKRKSIITSIINPKIANFRLAIDNIFTSFILKIIKLNLFSYASMLIQELPMAID